MSTEEEAKVTTEDVEMAEVNDAAVAAAVAAAAADEESPKESEETDGGIITTATATPTAAATTTGGAPFSIEARRKLKQEAYVTKGCGKNEVKMRIVSTFWDTVWPALEQLGWVKIAGTGSHSGSMTFLPNGAPPQEQGGVKGQDWYDKIKDVLDRLQERRTNQEAAVADQFDAEIIRKRELEEKARKKQNQSVRKRKFRTFCSTSGATGAAAAASSKSSSEASKLLHKLQHPLDLSWKDAGRIFPKRQSQVGPNYQVSVIPEAGTYTPPEPGNESYTLIYDPKAALDKGAVTAVSDEDDDEGEEAIETVIDTLPCNQREAALLLLSKRDYDPTDFAKVVEETIPFTDGSDWDEKKRADFHFQVFNTRKDLASVSKTLGITMETCLVYYYGKFKQTDDYRLVKTVCNDESEAAKSSRHFDGEQDACAICDDGGELVICDGCEGEYHMGCMKPPLKTIPEGHWECDECVDRKVLAVHDFLIRSTALFQRDTEKQHPGDGNDNAAHVEPIVVPTSPGDKKRGFRPTPASIASIKKLAGSISAAFAPNEATTSAKMDAETTEADKEE